LLISPDNRQGQAKVNYDRTMTEDQLYRFNLIRKDIKSGLSLYKEHGLYYAYLEYANKLGKFLKIISEGKQTDKEAIENLLEKLPQELYGTQVNKKTKGVR